MKKIRNPIVAEAIRTVERAGKPPRDKHWRCVGDGPEKWKVESVKTILSVGRLRVQHGPRKDEFYYEIVDAHSGLKLAAFGMKRIANTFVSRVGPTFDRLFEDIWMPDYEVVDPASASKRAECLLSAFMRLRELFRHDDLGEDDCDVPYELERPEWADSFAPSDWLDDKLYGMRVRVEGPCVVVRRGENGVSSAWLRKAKRKHISGPDETIWIRFERSSSELNEFPYLREYRSLRGALKA